MKSFPRWCFDEHFTQGPQSGAGVWVSLCVCVLLLTYVNSPVIFPKCTWVRSELQMGLAEQQCHCNTHTMAICLHVCQGFHSSCFVCVHLVNCPQLTPIQY